MPVTSIIISIILPFFTMFVFIKVVKCIITVQNNRAAFTGIEKEESIPHVKKFVRVKYYCPSCRCQINIRKRCNCPKCGKALFKGQ